MKIVIKYGVSQRSHSFDINLEEINKMIDTGELTLTHPTPKASKTLTITGTQAELSAMAQAFESAG